MSTIKPPVTPPYLTDEEMDELGDFLISDATSDETMMLDRLDGFLTALASGPFIPANNVWLPQVWGPTLQDEPTFVSDAQRERITSLIMKNRSSIVLRLRESLDTFDPVFDSAVYPDSEREFVDGEMWAYGYMTGIHLQREAWQRFFDDAQSAEVLHPIYLLGTEELAQDAEAKVETPEQREALSMQIPESIAAIYRFWQPYRVATSVPVSHFQREQPKIGRNEKCPCGSGRKFKKCCGVSCEPE
ncbi:MAG: UPF0149 family protein [Nitrosomonadales bacterium]